MDCHRRQNSFWVFRLSICKKSEELQVWKLKLFPAKNIIQMNTFQNIFQV